MTRKVIEAFGEDRLRASSRSDESAGPAQQDVPNPMLSQENEETVEARAVTIPRELFDFLMGVGGIDGTWFGDLNAGLPGRFWWRALLHSADTAALAPPIREHGEGVASKELRNIREQFAGIAALHPNEQPHYPNGVRPFGTGDLRHVIEVLDTALAALSAQPVKDAVREERQSVVAMLDGLRFGAAWLDDPQTLGDVLCDGAIPDPKDDSAAAVYEARQTLIDGILSLSPKSPASVGLDPETDPDLGEIGPGHVCKHGIRWPHPCAECYAAENAALYEALTREDRP